MTPSSQNHFFQMGNKNDTFSLTTNKKYHLPSKYSEKKLLSTIYYKISLNCSVDVHFRINVLKEHCCVSQDMKIS